MASEPRSFVVQVDPDASRASDDDLVGRVEDLDSGEWIRFRSARELLRFLREAATAPGEPR